MTYIVVLADGETFTDSEGVCVYEVIGDPETEEIEEALRDLQLSDRLKLSGRFLGGFYHRYDSAGTTFTPEDVEAEWEGRINNDRPDLPPFEEVWDNLAISYEWRKGIQDRLTEAGWDMISMMIDDYIWEHYKEPK